MTTRFADTYFYLALLDASDQHHGTVVEHVSHEVERHITTRWVLLEMANALAGTKLFRQKAEQLIRRLERDPDTLVLPAGDEAFEAGLALYVERPDKSWSLTDCISFAMMREQGIDEAPTGDRHFMQAGFRSLFAD